MDFLDNPEEMTPQERMEEVAAILAAGYLRLRSHQAAPAPSNEPPPFTEKPLDCSGGPRPLCVEGLTDGESAPAEVAP